MSQFPGVTFFLRCYMQKCHITSQNLTYVTKHRAQLHLYPYLPPPHWKQLFLSNKSSNCPKSVHLRFGTNRLQNFFWPWFSHTGVLSWHWKHGFSYWSSKFLFFAKFFPVLFSTGNFYVLLYYSRRLRFAPFAVSCTFIRRNLPTFWAASWYIWVEIIP